MRSCDVRAVGGCNARRSLADAYSNPDLPRGLFAPDGDWITARSNDSAFGPLASRHNEAFKAGSSAVSGRPAQQMFEFDMDRFHEGALKALAPGATTSGQHGTAAADRTIGYTAA